MCIKSSDESPPSVPLLWGLETGLWAKRGVASEAGYGSRCYDSVCMPAVKATCRLILRQVSCSLKPPSSKINGNLGRTG